MSNFNSITEQLKMKECKLVLGVCQTGKTRGYARWKSLDIQVCFVRNASVKEGGEAGDCVCMRARVRVCASAGGQHSAGSRWALVRTHKRTGTHTHTHACTHTYTHTHTPQVTDAANEAKDNVKYLATLEKSLEPMFNGTVQDITDTIPALNSNIRMMYTIARYYSTPGACVCVRVRVRVCVYVCASVLFYDVHYCTLLLQVSVCVCARLCCVCASVLI